MDMTIEQMKAAVAAAESAEIAASLPPGFRPAGIACHAPTFYRDQWALILQGPADGPDAKWRAHRFTFGDEPARVNATGLGATPTDAINACKHELLRLAKWADLAARELPEVEP